MFAASALAFAPPRASSPLLDLRLQADGKFDILVGGKPWLSGGDVRLGPDSSADGGLVLVGGPTETTGPDLGGWNATTYTWALKSQHPPGPVMTTTFRSFPAQDGTLVFEQGFPAGLPVLEPLGDTPSEGARTLFPSFARSSGADLPCFAYHGVFPQLKPCTVADYAPTHQGGVPLVIYDNADPSSPLPTTIFSPLSTPKAQHAASAPGWFGAGVKATAGAVPKGWSQSWILSATRGVNAAFQAWGDRVLALRGGKTARADLYRDVTHSTIGFWTDNGGYYHYSTGTGSTKFPNGSYIYNQSYEEVLPKVKASHDAAGVPFGHWQFDSWFYPKDATVGPGGGGGGVTNWTADPRIFPSGMAAINKALDGMPMVMHNRQWSPNSDYIKNLAFSWQTGPKWAIPDDPAAFFTWFFTTQQQGWGLTMYEQDWMCTEYDGVGALQSNVSLADVWLEGMAAGAAAGGLAVQYCMPYAHDILSGASHAAVTNARASDDYFHAPGHRNWAIGGTAMFYWGLGILPFKDGFYSSNLPQVGGQTVGPENDPDREALMATLSGAMVGPMDGIGLLNATRTMQSCRSDGVILKPDVPVTTDDWCFGHADPGCLVYSTYSEIPGYGRVTYLYSDAALSAQNFTEIMVAHGADAWYDWYSGKYDLTPGESWAGVGYEGHMYAVGLPAANGAVLLGEVDKYVPVSSKRFTKVVESKESLHLEMVGVKGESVCVCAAFNDAGKWGAPVCQRASFTDTTMMLDLARKPPVPSKPCGGPWAWPK